MRLTLTSGGAYVGKRSDDDEPAEIAYGDLNVGSYAVIDICKELARPRKLKPRRFPFGFTAPHDHTPPHTTNMRVRRRNTGKPS